MDYYQQEARVNSWLTPSPDMWEPLQTGPVIRVTRSLG